MPSSAIVYHLERLQQSQRLSPAEVNVLDWGCGRGQEVLWLRDRGYNAYGVDIEPAYLRNARELFKVKGHPATCLRVVEKGGQTDFADDFFHFTFSRQCFEHISDIVPVAAELYRITRHGGIGQHVYPADLRPIEGHLCMPFIHWLPKNRVRKSLIMVCALLRLEPRWPGMTETPRQKRVETYFQYSAKHTFYRRPSEMRRVFEKVGFQVVFDAISRPQVQQHPWVGRFARQPILKPLLNSILVHFVSQDLYLLKPFTASMRSRHAWPHH